MARKNTIARCVVLAILSRNLHEDAASFFARLFARIVAFFSLYRLRYITFRDDLFRRLRNETWEIEEDEYAKSFQGPNNKEPLQAKGDMGYSGSTFYTTFDAKYLIKSVPRRFEYTFFRNDLLEPFADYMASHPASLLIRITDFLSWRYVSLGGALGLAPTHHIVMENLLYGKEQAEKQNKNEKWETWDLKPTSYFFPERDIAGGILTSDETKARLADKFDDKIILSPSQADSLLAQLEEDTKLLEQCNAVDYSLFLVRIPRNTPDPFANPSLDAPAAEQNPPIVPPGPPSWRTGMEARDGKYVFRAAVLDFFWAKHKTHAKAMSGLIRAWNLVFKQGPMSITTSPEEYRARFLRMCREIVEVKE